MLLPRILTAAVGIPLVLWLIRLGSLPFLVFVLSITILCLYEYGMVLQVSRRPVDRWIVLAGGFLVAVGVSVGLPRLGAAGNGLAGAALTLSVAAAAVSDLFRKDKSLDRMALTCLGVMLVGWTLPHLYLIRDLRPDGEAFTWMLVACIWSMDTAAYTAGRLAGRRKLSSVSPNKTWEGAAAGFVVSVAAALAVRSFLAPEAISAAGAAAAGALIGTLGQMSDLVESMVKRASGVKESGYLLPGHGGVLDRFDSFLLAAPLLYYFLVFVIV